MANNPNSTPEQQADAILGAADRLITGFSTDALLEAFSDVIEILEGWREQTTRNASRHCLSSYRRSARG